MDKVKGVAKEGWHPKERSLKQMIRREKDPHSQAQDHISRPLATLKDPNAFGPPPKNVNYHGGAAVPNAITPDRRGLGAPLSTQEIQAKEEAERREARVAEEAARKPASPPIPYRADTSGLTTSNLPKPPVRRLEYDDQSSASPTRPNPKPKPSLPPRLPPRQGSVPTVKSQSPPPPYTVTSDVNSSPSGQINQGAAGRLAAAGVTVPGLGIGSKPQATYGTVAATASPSNQGASTDNAQLNELQSRFSRFSTKSQNPGSPSQGTTLDEKQAAVNTAQALRNDPSSVSLSDAKTTAATANNFRERHGDQVNAGWKSANAFNKKHDVSNRLNSYASQEGVSSKTEMPQSPSNPATATSSTSFPLHKRAPPPPPQKPSFGGGSTTSPPPVPISSKPRT
ncbi:MAG: hypothetical protein Q9216_006369 [Gyalolechia sp. 2 TL-2023]